MNNLVLVLQKLEEKIKTYDTSATVYFDVVGTYDGLTPFPLYEIDFRSLTEEPSDIFKHATLQINCHCSASYPKYSISGLNERYEKDKELRELVESWGSEMSQSEYSFGTITRYSSTIQGLDKSEIGNGNKGFRIFLEFDISYRDI